jgi:hypothetical protein
VVYSICRYREASVATFIYLFYYVVNCDILETGDDMPNSKHGDYVNKPFFLDKKKPDEKELYEWLQSLPRGKFKKDTLKFWLDKMSVDKEQD